MAPRNHDVPQTVKRKSSGSKFGPSDGIRTGEIITDVFKKKWRLGKSIGFGAFGDIFLASDNLSSPVSTLSNYVVKVEPHSSGPLFVERNFYLRVARKPMLDEWITNRKMKFLGVPPIISFGSHQLKNSKMRFIVIPRYNESIHAALLKHGNKLHVKTALTIAHYVVDALEYIHEKGYIHCDIKGQNLVLGDFSSHSAPVYLLDFGLATRFTHPDGTVKDFVADERVANAGTIEFSSRDSHRGVISRRSDLESLGYNIVYWLGGRLPWEKQTCPDLVLEAKEEAMSNIHRFLTSALSHRPAPLCLLEYFAYVSRLDFYSKPDYSHIRDLFRLGIREAGFLDDLKLTFDSHTRLKNALKRVAERENLPGTPKLKRMRTSSISTRKPLAEVRNTRITRNLQKTRKGTRKKKERFNWAVVLAGNPDRDIKKSLFKEKQRTSEPAIKPSGPAACNMNPTPAMRQVIKARKSRSSEVKGDNVKKQKHFETGTPQLTYAMLEVIAARNKSHRVLRSSSRKLLTSTVF